MDHDPAPPTGPRSTPCPDAGKGPSRLGRLASLPFIAVILLYRVTLSPLLGGQCRFEPTCSTYGLEAFRRHGPIRGTALTLTRILRCQPFSKGGYDPVPLWGQPRSPTIRAPHPGPEPNDPPDPFSEQDPASARPARYRPSPESSRPPGGPTDQEHP